MSGIVGLYHRNGRPADIATIDGMTAAIAHRGPDREGVWSDTNVGLGHRMLWTTPESLNEKLPLTAESSDLTITADARIYNRDELWAALGNTGKVDSEVADSELILAAYRKWGERSPEYLLGDFAFAIWDKRNQTLFCARDHFGVQPFYYYSSPQTFAFASEVKALLTLEEVPRRLNDLRIANYLTSAFYEAESTFFQDIHRLPPAHSLSVKREGFQLRRYWSLDPSRELRFGSVEESAEAFREIFTEAVRCRLRSAYPIGSFLSGGLDSSSVTCTARDILAEDGEKRLSTYSAIFDEIKECDERPYINAVLAQNNVAPHFVHGDRVSPLVDHDRVLWHQDEPLFAFNHSLNWSIYAAASNDGARVILDGFDGDSTVSHGIGYLVELARAWRWFALVPEIRGLAKTFDFPIWGTARDLAWRHSISPMIPNPIKRMGKSALRAARGNRGSNPNSIESTSILNPEFINRVGLAEHRKAARQPQPLTERQAHYQTLSWPVGPYALEVLSKSTAAFSIEPRYPFFDKRLAEFCLALPGDHKINRGWTRMVMRRGLANTLPKEVQWRPGKTSIGPNFRHVFLTFERETIEDVIEKDTSGIDKYFDMDVLRAAHIRIQSNQYQTEEDLTNIWKAVTLALWLRQIKI